MTTAQAGELFSRNGLPLDDARINRLLEYERLLLGWNEKINLVSRRETTDLFIKQLLGSVSFLFSHTLAPGSALLDVGTGGGLPGIPLAIIQPDLQITIIDSIRKKMTAVTDMVGKLGIRNVRVLCGRVEELDPEIVGTFDYIVARGVSSASDIIGWCAPLLRRGDTGRRAGSGAGNDPRKPVPRGSYILLKGGDLTAELASLSEITSPASVTVRPLAVEGAEEAFTEKKVIVITP